MASTARPRKTAAKADRRDTTVAIIERLVLIETGIVDNARRLGIIEDGVVAVDSRLEAHCAKDETALHNLHACHDISAAKIDLIATQVTNLETNIGLLVVRSAGRGAWSLALIMRRTLMWGAPFAGAAVAVYGWYIGKWPFP